MKTESSECVSFLNGPVHQTTPTDCCTGLTVKVKLKLDVVVSVLECFLKNVAWIGIYLKHNKQASVNLNNVSNIGLTRKTRKSFI